MVKCIREDCNNKISLYCPQHSIYVEKKVELAKKQGQIEAWERMLKAVYNWNKEIHQTETSIEFEMFIKDKLKELKKK